MQNFEYESPSVSHLSPEAYVIPAIAAVVARVGPAVVRAAPAVAAAATSAAKVATTAVTKAKCVAWFRNFLIWGNTYEGAEKPTRIRWSNIGTTETYSDADYIDIAELGGQEIEAFGVLYDNLYIFLTNSIWKLSFVGGDEIFVVSRL